MSQESVQKLMDRWMNEPTFRTALRQDPEGTVKKAGVTLSAEELAALRKVNWKLSDSELKAQLSKGM